MARPSKLTPNQWEELNKELLAGKSVSEVAKQFKVSRATVINKGKKPMETVKAVANQLVAAEDALRALPVSEQLLTIQLADELRAISGHLAGAAKYGAATAHRLAGISHGLVQRIDDADPLASMEQLKAVAAMTKMANEAAHVGLNLVAANKDRALKPEDDNVPAGLEHFYGEDA